MLAALRDAARPALLDAHADPDHHRCVLTLGGEAAELLAPLRMIALTALGLVDLRSHRGVHPRFGSLDVVPFAPASAGPLEDALVAREAALALLAELGLPCFRYGPLPDGTSRSLPEVRRGAFGRIRPDAGPDRPHPTAGAVAVGARQPLLAWNAWITGATLEQARAVAAGVRSDAVRALGLPVRGGTQVSCNLLDPARVTPLEVLGRIEAALPDGARVDHCEQVGLVPDAVLAAVPAGRWGELGLDAERAVGAVLGARGTAMG